MSEGVWGGVVFVMKTEKCGERERERERGKED
jgi:hypothetical protein